MPPQGKEVGGIYISADLDLAPLDQKVSQLQNLLNKVKELEGQSKGALGSAKSVDRQAKITASWAEGSLASLQTALDKYKFQAVVTKLTLDPAAIDTLRREIASALGTIPVPITAGSVGAGGGPATTGPGGTAGRHGKGRRAQQARQATAESNDAKRALESEKKALAEERKIINEIIAVQKEMDALRAELEGAAPGGGRYRTRTPGTPGSAPAAPPAYTYGQLRGRLTALEQASGGRPAWASSMYSIAEQTDRRGRLIPAGTPVGRPQREYIRALALNRRLATDEAAIRTGRIDAAEAVAARSYAQLLGLAGAEGLTPGGQMATMAARAGLPANVQRMAMDLVAGRIPGISDAPRGSLWAGGGAGTGLRRKGRTHSFRDPRLSVIDRQGKIPEVLEGPERAAYITRQLFTAGLPTSGSIPGAPPSYRANPFGVFGRLFHPGIASLRRGDFEEGEIGSRAFDLVTNRGKPMSGSGMVQSFINLLWPDAATASRFGGSRPDVARKMLSGTRRGLAESSGKSFRNLLAVATRRMESGGELSEQELGAIIVNSLQQELDSLFGPSSRQYRRSRSGIVPRGEGQNRFAQGPNVTGMATGAAMRAGARQDLGESVPRFARSNDPQVQAELARKQAELGRLGYYYAGEAGTSDLTKLRAARGWASSRTGQSQLAALEGMIGDVRGAPARRRAANRLAAEARGREADLRRQLKGDTDSGGYAATTRGLPSYGAGLESDLSTLQYKIAHYKGDRRRSGYKSLVRQEAELRSRVEDIRAQLKTAADVRKRIDRALDVRNTLLMGEGIGTEPEDIAQGHQRMAALAQELQVVSPRGRPERAARRAMRGFGLSVRSRKRYPQIGPAEPAPPIEGEAAAYGERFRELYGAGGAGVRKSLAEARHLSRLIDEIGRAEVGDQGQISLRSRRKGGKPSIPGEENAAIIASVLAGQAPMPEISAEQQALVARYRGFSLRESDVKKNIALARRQSAAGGTKAAENVETIATAGGGGGGGGGGARGGGPIDVRVINFKDLVGMLGKGGARIAEGKSGISIEELAKEYGVDVETARKIVSGEMAVPGAGTGGGKRRKGRGLRGTQWESEPISYIPVPRAVGPTGLSRQAEQSLRASQGVWMGGIASTRSEFGQLGRDIGKALDAYGRAGQPIVSSRAAADRAAKREADRQAAAAARAAAAAAAASAAPPPQTATGDVVTQYLRGRYKGAVPAFPVLKSNLSIDELMQAGQAEAERKAAAQATKATMPERAPSTAVAQVFARITGFKSRYERAAREEEAARQAVEIAGKQRAAAESLIAPENAAEGLPAGRVRQRLEMVREQVWAERRGPTGQISPETLTAWKAVGQEALRVKKEVKERAGIEEKAQRELEQRTQKREAAAGAIASAGQVGSLFVGAKLFMVANQVFDTALQETTRALQPATDALMGFGATMTRVTSQMADATIAAKGNLRVAMAGQAGPLGISAESAAYMQERLGAGAYAMGGAKQIKQAADLYRATLGASLQGGQGPTLFGVPLKSQSTLGPAPKGLFEGYGGLGGTPFLAEMMGGGPGYTETLGDLIEDTSKSWKDQQNLLDDINKAYTRYSESTGQAGDSNIRLARVSDDLRAKFMAIGAAAGDAQNAMDMAASGVGLVNERGGMVTAQQYREFFAGAAAGQTIPDARTAIQTMIPQMTAQLQGLSISGAVQRNVTTPGNYGMQLMANPFVRSSRGGLAPEFIAGLPNEAAIRESMGRSRATKAGLETYGAAGVASLDAFVAQQLGPGSPGADAEALKSWESSLTRISDLGLQIRDTTEQINYKQASLGAAQFANSQRLAQRALQDALAMAGKRYDKESGVIGALQKQSFELQRQSQRLSFILQQRQIAVGKATIGFGVSGESPQERAARIEQAKEQFAIEEQQLSISKKQYGIGGAEFAENARRAVEDARASLDLLEQGYYTAKEIEALQSEIMGYSQALAAAQSAAGDALNQANTTYQTLLSTSIGLYADHNLALQGVNDAYDKLIKMLTTGTWEEPIEPYQGFKYSLQAPGNNVRVGNINFNLKVEGGSSAEVIEDINTWMRKTLPPYIKSLLDTSTRNQVPRRG